MRAYYSAKLSQLAEASADQIIGQMASRMPFALELRQREAWRSQIAHLAALGDRFADADVFFEFVIPRMGRRADAIILYKGIIFILEYKKGSQLSKLARYNKFMGIRWT